MGTGPRPRVARFSDTMGARVSSLIDRAISALQYPADDPQATLVVVLAIVALGLLVAAVLMAIASPRQHTDSNGSDTPDE